MRYAWLTRSFLVLSAALASAAPLQAANELIALDEQVLKDAGVGTDGPSLLAFIRKKTLQDNDRKQIDGLIAQLGDSVFSRREEASIRLIMMGSTALPFLNRALGSFDAEVAKRAGECILAIQRGPGSGLTVAAVRVLVERRPAEALAALLNFFPFAEDRPVEQEVLAGLTVLGGRPDAVDPVLSAALKDDFAGRRAAAAFAVGRSGHVPLRTAVRELLADTDAQVRRLAALGLLGDQETEPSAEQPALDAQQLKDSGVGADAVALLDYFRKRTLTDEDRRAFTALVQQLGDDRFGLRQEATLKLIQAGQASLPFLRPALTHADPEVVTRAEHCLTVIGNGPGSALAAAAIRSMVRVRPPEGVAVLLNFASYADDDLIEDEVLTALCQLSVETAEVPAALSAALADPLPAKRAAAAYVLGRVGTAEQLQAVPALLHDPEPRVRFRTAQALLALRDKAAVPVLLELLKLAERQPDLALLAEDLLQRIAGERAPEVSLRDTATAALPKYQDAWAAWWQAQARALEIAPPEVGPRQLGLTLVAELDSNRVWECGRDGKPRWELTNLMGPIDAQVLAGGRVLIAEHQGQRVTERDLKGTIHWEHRVNGNPIVCQRLPNGNTFIATYNLVLEVTRQKKELYSFNPNPNPQFPIIYGAHKMRNGNIAVISGQGDLVEYETSGKKVRSIKVGNNGGWCSVEAVAGGRFLVALTNLGKVVEVDAAGKTLHTWNVPGASHATPLGNGRILVACMNNRRMVEMDASGRTLWEKPTTGRPFHVHRR